MKSTFGSYYAGTLLHPRRTFDRLITDPHRLRLGFLALLISLVLYAFVYIFLTMGGAAPSSVKPWLAIPADVYYSYDRFMLPPSMLGSWILAAGLAQLLGILFGGKGTFEDNLSVFGFSIGIATLFSLAHDLTDSLMGAIGLLDLRWYEVQLISPTIWRTILWTFYGLSLVFFVVLFPKAVGASQRLGRWPALIIGLLSFITYQGVFFIFNR